MNPKYSSYLFTELIVRLSNNSAEHDEIYHELIDRLIFCKMDYDTAVAFIQLEKLIVKIRKIDWKFMLYNHYWWLNEDLKLKKSDNSLFNNEFNKYLLFINEKYYKYNVIPKTLLTVSELLSLMDEATYIDINFKDKGIFGSEIDFFKSVSYDKKNKNVDKDIYFRVMSSYEVAHKSSNFPSDIEQISKRFYANEINILFLCKWTFKKNINIHKKKYGNHIHLNIIQYIRRIIMDIKQFYGIGIVDVYWRYGDFNEDWKKAFVEMYIPSDVGENYGNQYCIRYSFLDGNNVENEELFESNKLDFSYNKINDTNYEVIILSEKHLMNDVQLKHLIGIINNKKDLNFRL